MKLPHWQLAPWEKEIDDATDVGKGVTVTLNDGYFFTEDGSFKKIPDDSRTVMVFARLGRARYGSSLKQGTVKKREPEVFDEWEPESVVVAPLRREDDARG